MSFPDNLKQKYGGSLQLDPLLFDVTLEVKKTELIGALEHLKNEGFWVLTDLSAVDFLKPEIHTKIFYQLQNPKTYDRIRVFTYINREESLPSVVTLWPGADWYERELFDMFGISFDGHPDLKRILMPDDWIGHPMRRDYALTEVPVQFKHDVKPKVPSKIIPYVRSKQK